MKCKECGKEVEFKESSDDLVNVLKAQIGLCNDCGVLMMSKFCEKMISTGYTPEPLLVSPKVWNKLNGI